MFTSFRCFVLAAALVVAVPFASAVSADLPVLPPAGHPRVLLRPEQLPAIRASRNDPALQAAWAELRRRAALPPDYQPAPRYDLAVMHAAEASALLALVDEDRAMARRAVGFAFTLLGAEGPGQNLGYFGRQAVGGCIFTVAKVYDWCHDALTPEERRRLCALMREHATVMEIGFPPVTAGSISGHSSGSQLLRDQLGMAIATFDEDPEIYDLVAGRFFREYPAARDFFYPAGFHHQGNAYGAGRFDCEVWAALLLTRMGAPAPWNLSAMSQVPYFFLYLRRPDGGLIEDGDDYLSASRPEGSYWAPNAHQWLHWAALFRDPQFAAEWRRILVHVETRYGERDEPVDPVLTILLRPDRVPDGDRADLPLSRYFPEPLGAIVARTGWNIGPASRDVTAYLKIGTHHFDNHQHADSGQFQLFYRGALALDSGIYQSNDTSYAQPHHINYARRTIAHNTLLIEDPDETFTFVGKPIANDGGQRAMEPAEIVEDFWRQPTRTGRVLAHFVGPDPRRPEVSLIKGDLTPAYASSKARRVTRTMVFLPLDDARAPAALIVLDRVASVKPEQRKVALLHSMDEPPIEGNVTTVTRSGPQVEVRRVDPKNVVQPDPADATLVFDLSSLAGARIRQAELSCAAPSSRAGEIAVSAEGRHIATVKGSGGSFASLPNVTAWLQEAVGGSKAEARLTLKRIGGDSRGVLANTKGREGPHLRVWLEAEPMAGKLVQTTLLPARDHLDLRKVGGPGREFVAGGRNWPATPAIPEPMGGVEAGAWRVEIGDNSGAAATRFLNVYQVMDADARPGAVRLIEGRGVIGASVSGRIVIASASDEPLAAGASFEIGQDDVGPDGHARVVLTDLPAGDHSLWQGDRLKAMGAVEVGSQTWFAALRPGRYELRSR